MFMNKLRTTVDLYANDFTMTIITVEEIIWMKIAHFC